MKKDFAKITIAIIAILFFIWSDFDAFNSGFMHAINFPIHEIGHVIFSPFGQFIAVAGGSIFQILAPIFFFFYFFLRGEKFSASLVLLWVGNNFFDVAVYANDAVFMELPLVSFSGNEATTIHDWNYLLSETGMLHRTNLVAAIIRAIGIVVSCVGIIAAFYFARKEEKFPTL